MNVVVFCHFISHTSGIHLLSNILPALQTYWDRHPLPVKHPSSSSGLQGQTSTSCPTSFQLFRLTGTDIHFLSNILPALQTYRGRHPLPVKYPSSSSDLQGQTSTSCQTSFQLFRLTGTDIHLLSNILPALQTYRGRHPLPVQHPPGSSDLLGQTSTSCQTSFQLFRLTGADIHFLSNILPALQTYWGRHPLPVKHPSSSSDLQGQTSTSCPTSFQLFRLTGADIHFLSNILPALQTYWDRHPLPVKHPSSSSDLQGQTSTSCPTSSRLFRLTGTDIHFLSNILPALQSYRGRHPLPVHHPPDSSDLHGRTSTSCPTSFQLIRFTGTDIHLLSNIIPALQIYRDRHPLPVHHPPDSSDLHGRTSTSCPTSFQLIRFTGTDIHLLSNIIPALQIYRDRHPPPIKHHPALLTGTDIFAVLHFNCAPCVYRLALCVP